jgi:hypothetical protein
MRRSLYIIGSLLVLSILLVGMVSAAVPDSSSTNLTPNKEWMVANGEDTAILSFKAMNASNPLQNLPVLFTIDDVTLAKIIYVSPLTGSDGSASTQIMALKKSGTVLVNATVYYRINETDLLEPLKSVTFTYPQKIDHDSPFMIASDTFPNGIVTVGTNLTLVLQMRDEWGNLVENKNPAVNETLKLSIQGSPQDLAVINNGTNWVKDLDIQVDDVGNFSALARLSTAPGFHQFLVTPVKMSVSEKPYYVRTVANGAPAIVTSLIGIDRGIGSSTENPPSIVADGFGRYIITYTLFDQYGNPVSDRILNFDTNLSGEQQLLPASTNLGEVKILYGPKDRIMDVLLNVVSIDNSSVNINNTVTFVPGAPKDMNLTANPEMMPSRDVPGMSAAKAQITAKIVTEAGYASPNQTVTFSLGSIEYDGDYTRTSEPSIDQTTAVTDELGYATVNFSPGGFTTNELDQKFSGTATGRCTVTSTWNGTIRNLILTWKNYPYLSAEASVSPKVVNVSDNISVTLKLKGDGWALYKPVDIVVVTDLAGGIGGAGLLVATQTADKAFVNQAGNSTYIGLVSFGNSPEPYSADALSKYNQQNVTTHLPYLFNPYGTVWDWCLWSPTKWDERNHLPSEIISPGSIYYPWTQDHYYYFNSYSGATIDADLTAPAYRSNLINIIDNKYKSKGGTNYAAGINAAIQVFQNNPNPGHAKAIIIMGDGIPMMAPVANGSLDSYWPSDWHPRSDLGWEDESDTAINAAVDSANRAKAMGIPVYAAGFKLGPAPGWVDNATFLKLVSAPDHYYYTPDPTKLDQVLLTIQGRIQSEAGVETTADLNYGTVKVDQQPVSGVFDYVYQVNASTKNQTYWKNGTNINGPNYYDQTSDWADKVLTFNVGTIKVNQIWETSYKLKVLKKGSINVFGEGSKISFNNNTANLLLPNITITSHSSTNGTGSENLTKTLTISDLNVTMDGSLANLSVDINILPNTPDLSVTAEIYITDEDQHTTTWIKTVEISPIVNGRMNITSIDLSEYPKGKKYTFYVDFINKQPGTNPIYWAQLTSNGFVILAKPTGIYIKLE